MIRSATLADIDVLVSLENRCFDTDRISRRSFRHMLSRGHTITLVEQQEDDIIGYVLVLLRKGTSLGRIYSIAVDPASRGRGVATGLITAVEAAALDNDCVLMRSEIRKDNPASQALFAALGYRPFGVYEGYYEDAMDALRFEKHLAPHLDAALARVPYYRQTLEFTCGPAALMMAMKALDAAVDLNRKLELRIWRESTTIYMTSGHGGCGPHGLALAAYKRGFDVELYLKDAGSFLIDSVRSIDKKVVMELVQQDFEEQLRTLPVPIHYRTIGADDLEALFQAGGIPLVLISSYKLYGEKFPHWVVVSGFDSQYIYVSDPYVDVDAGKTVMDCINIPIVRPDFDRMARYGKSGQTAVLIVFRRGDRPA